MKVAKYKRIFVVVLDSLGIGAMPDAWKFDDSGSDTFGHICSAYPELSIPNLRKLGMLNLHPVVNMPAAAKPLGTYLRLKEKSVSKDTMAGHWEMMGVKTTTPFITFPDGFPAELVSALEEKTGHKVIGNKVASGTTILEELGQQSMDEDALILYTSADSVLQLAANEETFGLEELYRCCEIAREITMKDEWKVGRVIARPFVREEDKTFTRTSNRHDYTVEPPTDTVLDILKDGGVKVIGVGKIGDIFSNKGLTESVHSDSSIHGMEQTIEYAASLDKFDSGLCFVNLVDFDSKYGHRRDPIGYGQEIERFDVKLGELMKVLRDDDLVMLTADHGNDPIYKGSDHTREYVFLLNYSPSIKKSAHLDDASSFGCIGATILDNFGMEMPENLIGDSILGKL